MRREVYDCFVCWLHRTTAEPGATLNENWILKQRQLRASKL